MTKQVQLPDPDWSQILAQATGDKGQCEMKNLVAALEKAARKEQEDLKRKIRPQVEGFRQLAGHKQSVP